MTRPGPAGLAASSNRAALLMAPRVFRAPEGPAAREARASLRSAPRLEARPCPPVPPAPSTPVGPERVCSKPGQVPQASPRPLLTSLLSSPNVACNSPATLSNHEFTTLESQRFQTFSKCRPIQLHAIFWGAVIWLRTGVADLSRETAVAFARLCPCGLETGGTFARVFLCRIETLVSFAGLCGGPVETTIAFAGSKWVFFVRYSVAEVLSVSTAAVQGRAAVSGVSNFW